MSDGMKMTLKASWTRNYGKHTVTFGVEVDSTIVHRHDAQRVYDRLLAGLDAQFDEFERTRLPKLKDTEPPKNNYPARDRDTFPVTEVRVEISNGEKLVRIAGERYSKFGVAMYRDADFSECADFYEWEPGAHDVFVQGLTAQVDVVGGKPKRVTKVY